MKVAVSSNGKDLDSQIDPRFGRCLYFIIVETDNMSFEAFQNENSALPSSAGIQSASFVASHNVKVVLTGNCGPKAAQVFSAANIEVVTGMSGTIQEAIRQFKNGDVNTNINATSSMGDTRGNSQPLPGANPGMSGGGMGMRGGGRCMGGMGGGRGGGMGGGRGGGMGGGRGGGMGGGQGGGRGIPGGNPGRPNADTPVPDQTNSAAVSKESQLKQLKMEEENLRNQIRGIQSRIENLK